MSTTKKTDNDYRELKTINCASLSGRSEITATYSYHEPSKSIMFRITNNTGSGKDATIESYIRPFGGVFNLKRIVSAFENNFYFPNRLPFYVDEKSDIEIRAISTAAGAPVSVGFDLILVDKTAFE